MSCQSELRTAVIGPNVLSNRTSMVINLFTKKLFNIEKEPFYLLKLKKKKIILFTFFFKEVS